MSQARYITFLSTAKYLPSKRITAEQIDQKLGVPSNWSVKATGVQQRYFSDGETAAKMGAKTLSDALHQADLKLSDLDALISVSGTMQQLIPCNAALIAAELGVSEGMITYDINATCLGFLVGLDLLAYPLQLGHYKRIALIASDIASVGLNWQQKESAALFGDGAAAIILGASDMQGSKIVASHFETYPGAAQHCQIRGGSTMLHAKHHCQENQADYFFDMHGTKLFKLVMQKIPPFLDHLLSLAQLKLNEIDLVIPHQASLPALKLIQKRLDLSEEQFFINIDMQGNTIAASIPMALHDAKKQGRIKRGSRLLLIGSSAGVSLGGVILEW